MSIAEVKAYTPEDLLTMPDGDRYELVDGQLVEKNMGAESCWIGSRLYFLIETFLQSHQQGWAIVEASCQCFPDDPGKVRKPDVIFIKRGRLAEERIPKGYIQIVPDLVVEVVSPNDLYYEVEAKVEEYRGTGVPLVWVVNPDTRTVQIFRQTDDNTQRLYEQDELTGEDVLPGFRCQVSEILPPAVS